MLEFKLVKKLFHVIVYIFFSIIAYKYSWWNIKYCHELCYILFDEWDDFCPVNGWDAQ